MKQKIRPLSPHLTIYKMQLTSLLSIFHRVSGSIVGLLMIVSFWLFYVGIFNFGEYVQYFFLFDLLYLFAPLVLAFEYFILSLMSFHVLNGFRHLSWDLAFGLEVKNLYISGGIVLSLVFCVIFLSIVI